MHDPGVDAAYMARQQRIRRSTPSTDVPSSDAMRVGAEVAEGGHKPTERRDETPDQVLQRHLEEWP